MCFNLALLCGCKLPGLEQACLISFGNAAKFRNDVLIRFQGDYAYSRQVEGQLMANITQRMYGGMNLV